MSDRRKEKVTQIIEKSKVIGQSNLLEAEAKEMLKEYGLPVADFRPAESRQEAIAVAEDIEYPVAVKILSPQFIHKLDAWGVKLNIKNKDEVAKAFTEIINNARSYNKEAKIYRVIITPMEDKGIETIIGMTSDQTFGPTIMFGLGGIFVEMLKDVSFRVAPLTRRDAYDMIKQIEGFPILEGVRGQKPADVDALADAIMKVSALVMDNPEIRELDLNPVFAFENGASIADARAIISISD